MDIKIGPDGIADRQQVIELLEAQIGQMRETIAETNARYAVLSNNWDLKLSQARSLNERDAKDLKRLRSKQMQILERWVRHEAVRRDVIQHRLIVMGIGTGIALVTVPLFIVVMSLAWRLAVWAVLS